MFLSALALAAALQAAPAATSVVIPQGAPVVGQKGYLLQRKPFDPAQRVDQLRMPFAKPARPVTADEARVRRNVSPSFKMKPPRRSPLGFVRNPQMVNCDENGLTRTSRPGALKVEPLSKMPKARGERAVARLVDGCPVAVTIAQGPIER